MLASARPSCREPSAKDRDFIPPRRYPCDGGPYSGSPRHPLWPDRRATSPATSGARDEVAPSTGPASATRPAGSPATAAESPTGPELEPSSVDSTPASGLPTSRTASPGGDADRSDLAVFRDLLFALELVVIRWANSKWDPRIARKGVRDERPQHRVANRLAFCDRSVSGNLRRIRPVLRGKAAEETR